MLRAELFRWRCHSTGRGVECKRHGSRRLRRHMQSGAAGVVELNTKGRYAVTAMADLAKYGAGDAVPLSAIAERQQISLAYLEQLFAKLRRAGLVESERGRAGGYRLGAARRRASPSPRS